MSDSHGKGHPGKIQVIIRYSVFIKLLMKKILSVFLACLLFTVCVSADDNSEATAFMRGISNNLLEQLKNRDLYEKDTMQYYQMLENEVLNFMNMELMSKLILRTHWTTASSDQKTRFLSSFKNMLLESYGKTLLLLPNIKIEFIEPPADQKPRKYQIVHTKLFTSGNEPPVSLDYYLIKQEEWKIFDLRIDGLSVIKQFRESFGEEIATTNLNALIERLNNSFSTEAILAQ